MKKSQLLKVGDQGRFELKAPFTNLIHPQWVYTVRSIRSISEIINDGADPKTLYEKYEVPAEQQELDFKNNICIIGLQSHFGRWVHVPETFIETMPETSGVAHKPLTAVVYLGLVDDEQDLTDFEEQLKSVTLKELGIEAQIKFVAVGSTRLITHEEAMQLKTSREQALSNKDSLSAQVLSQLQEIEHLKLLNNELSKTIQKLTQKTSSP